MEHDERLVGVIVFLASVLIPLLKPLGLLYLVSARDGGSGRRPLARTWDPPDIGRHRALGRC
jgi:uncharacterized paraquat-inducible protein A